MTVDLDLLTAGLELRRGAPEDTIQRVEAQLRVRFPDEYREFIRYSNGAGGEIGGVGLGLWRIEEIPAIMEAWKIEERVPGLVPFGSDGSRETFVFDLSRDPPPVGLADVVCARREDVLVRASGFYEFLRIIRKSGKLFPPDL